MRRPFMIALLMINLLVWGSAGALLVCGQTLDPELDPLRLVDALR